MKPRLRIRLVITVAIAMLIAAVFYLADVPLGPAALLAVVAITFAAVEGIALLIPRWRPPKAGTP